MVAYTVRRLLLLVPTLLCLSMLAFGVAHLVPGDPAEEYLRRTTDEPPTPEAVAAVRAELGLDRPLPAEYLHWLGRAVKGDFGISFGTRRPVSEEFAYRLPYTIRLALPAALLALLLALPVGILAAVHRNRWGDQLLRIVSLAGSSMPSFWLALLLIELFAVKAQILPVFGTEGSAALVLPVLTLALTPAAVLARFTRSTMLETLGADWVRTAQAKGVPWKLVVERHVLRGSLVPLVTAFGHSFARLLVGAVIIETIFAWPGVAKLGVDSINQHDYPVLQAFVLYSGALFVVINLIIDLSYGLLDPRIRVGRMAS